MNIQRKDLKVSCVTSLLFTCLVSGSAFAASQIKKPLEAGPIANDAEAQKKCTYLARQNRARWTGQWWSIASGDMAVCELEVLVRDINAGRQLSNKQEATSVCPTLAQKYRARWTGQYRTDSHTRQSVCQLDYSVRELDAGFIKNQNHAKNRCQQMAQQNKARWTGRWRTTIQGRMSVCQLNFT
ncbi:MAG: mannan-binding protein [Leucothrix sp.]